MAGRKRAARPQAPTAEPALPANAKRRKGRPVSGQNDVGRTRLLAAAEKLLRELPPARVTVARIAQESAVDPALVRYYFGNRTALLLAVAEEVTRRAPHTAVPVAAAPDALADHIRRTLRFTRSAPFMHRLMIEELADAGDEASQARVREMNRDLIGLYRRLLDADAGATLRAVDPLLLHLLVLGTADFYASAEPLIRQLVPARTSRGRLAARFEDFVVEVVLGGLRKR